MLEVIEKRVLSPHAYRLSFTADGLGEREFWPGAHIKLFFPRTHQKQPVLPRLGDDGRPVWPPPGERPVTRTYSVRAYHADAQVLDVDFVVHDPGAGPASSWAKHAKVHDRVGLAGPGGPRPLVPAGAIPLLAGDLSAAGAIEALVECQPEDAQGQVFIQVPDAADIRPLEMPPGFQVSWLVEGERDLVDAVRAASWPNEDFFLWLAGEASQVVALRDHALRDRGLDAKRMYAIPFWKRKQNEETYHEERHREMDALEELQT